MSTSGGAAGLTLTVARTAFILEPSLNPGLEAQAAARICRLGTQASECERAGARCVLHSGAVRSGVRAPLRPRWRRAC